MTRRQRREAERAAQAQREAEARAATRVEARGPAAEREAIRDGAGASSTGPGSRQTMVGAHAAGESEVAPMTRRARRAAARTTSSPPDPSASGTPPLPSSPPSPGAAGTPHGEPRIGADSRAGQAPSTSPGDRQDPRPQSTVTVPSPSSPSRTAAPPLYSRTTPTAPLASSTSSGRPGPAAPSAGAAAWDDIISSPIPAPEGMPMRPRTRRRGNGSESAPAAEPTPAPEAPAHGANSRTRSAPPERDLTPTVETIKPSWHGDERFNASRSVRRRSGAGWAGRISVMTVLGLVTVVAPISARLSADPLATAAGAQAAAPSAAASAPASSVAAAVLGSDADVDSSSDSELSDVPDAATLARIHDAYENAAATCASQSTGASGDTSAFTKAPEIFYPMVEGTYTISSPYGYRLHPTLGYMKLHAGQDFAAPVGTPIYAAAAGKVVTAGMDEGVGTVTIEHNIDGQIWYTSYLHMYEDGIYVKVGDTVEAGQLIAGVGNTGRSSGSHLHFEVRTKNDTADESTVDPQKWLDDHHAAELSTDCS